MKTDKLDFSGLKFINAGTSPTGGDHIEVFIYDYIGPEWAGMISADMVRNELRRSPDADLVTVHINSGGGSIIEALAIYNLFNESAARVEVVIDGLAGSSAGWVAMAADEIRIAENAYFMLHDPTAPANGKAAELRSQADKLDLMKNSIVNMFAKRTGIEAAEIANMMAAETWINGTDAAAKGFADSVIESKGYQVNCDLSGFGNVPDYVKGLANATPPPATPPAKPAEVLNNSKPADTSGINSDGPDPASVDADLAKELGVILG